MTPETVLSLVELLKREDVPCWLDGGWGVDALLGEQTRAHSDLDLVVSLNDTKAILALFETQGFRVTEDQLPVRYVLHHSVFGQVDFHPVSFDEAGNGWQALPDGDTFCYPAAGFASGSVLARAVPALSAEVQMLAHTGYEPTEKDIKDVLLLHQRLGAALPQTYQLFVNNGVRE